MSAIPPILRRIGRFIRLTVCCFETAMLAALLAVVGACYIVGLALGASGGGAILEGSLLIVAISFMGVIVYQMVKGLAAAGRAVGRWTREQWRATGEAGQ